MTPSTKALLIAPSVQEADGAFLRPDMIPLGPSVYIPGYDRTAIGDKITLTWTGGPTSDGRWTEQKVIDTIDGDIVFHVPTLVLAAAESYEAVTGYVLRRQGSDVDEPSDTATYTVRNHPPIRTIQVRDQNGLPTSIIDHAAEWFEAELPEEVSISLQQGDEIVFWLRTMDLFASTTILATSEAATIRFDEDSAQHPVRHRFGRHIVVANHGNTLLLDCAIVRANGYVQHAETNVTLTITQEPVSLGKVLTAQLHEDEVFLDRPGFEEGLAVSIPYQAEMKGTHIRFCLGEYRTRPIPAREGKLVEGLIPNDELHRQASTNGYLYCLAVKGSDAQEIVIERSLRRHMTIRHSRTVPPFPEADVSLEAPSIDGYIQGPMDQAHFPGGPFARIRAQAGIATGDIVTYRFHTPAGLLTWEDSSTIGDPVGVDVVRRIPMANVAYYRYAMPSLYYSVESVAGERRFSPRREVTIREYAPRSLYHLACSMRESLEGEALIHCPPDATLLLVVEGNFLGLALHDRLVVMLRGATIEASTVIENTIDTEPDSRWTLPVPAAVIRDNAGHDIFYRVTKIRGRYIEHTPFRALHVDAQA